MISSYLKILYCRKILSFFTFSFFSLHRSVVYQQSSKESATLQPFFTLQLDIQSDKIRTVQDALESLVARESVQGYTTKTKQEVCSVDPFLQSNIKTSSFKGFYSALGLQIASWTPAPRVNKKWCLPFWCLAAVRHNASEYIHWKAFKEENQL